MKCEQEHIPDMVLLGMVMHMSGRKAKFLFDRYELNKSQASILLALQNSEVLSQKELARRLNVTPPSITSAIQKMEKTGFIKRKPDESDQRVMRLGLTEKGAGCIDHVKRVAEQMDQLMFQGISLEEKLLFRRILMQIFQNLEETDDNVLMRELQ